MGTLHFLPPPPPRAGIDPMEAIDSIRELASEGMSCAATTEEWQRFARIHRLAFKAQIRNILERGRR